MGGSRGASAEALAELGRRYELDVRPETVPELLSRFGLCTGEPLRVGWSPPGAQRTTLER